MEKEKHTVQRIVAAAVLVAIALVSVLWLSKLTSSPEFHRDSIAALDERKVTVMELTAATAVSSIAVSMLPGDATTPIADQIAELSSYLMIVAGVIMLEKFLLTMTGYVAFTFLIPLACGLGVLYVILRRGALRELAIRLGLFGLIICLIIPASIRVSDLFEETFQLHQTVLNASQATEDIQTETEAETGEDEEKPGGIAGWFSQIGEQITSGVSQAADRAEEVLNSFIDAVAVLLISNCVIPILVLGLFLWLTKAVITMPLESWKKREDPEG